MPGDCDRLFYQLTVVRVYFFTVNQVIFNPLLLCHLGVTATAKVVGGKHNTLVLVNALRGIPDLLDRRVYPGDSSVDAFFLPESLFGLKSGLVRLTTTNILECIHILGWKTVWDAAHQVARYAIEAVIGLQSLRSSILFVGNFNPVIVYHDGGDRAAKFNSIAKPIGEAIDDSVHTTDRLH